ncbi:hypothetical protein [Sphingomonas sp.]|jgi:hypothetical protein|uniref:tail fiber domain-containing protein n=1 Tax=Sphingomonas sp. TaxID=28214 RepID=UPI00261C0AAC|nr:hypothetical protein [Sphingomonas sp.]MDF2496062.1 hypothetical protein [Sphingomonas sp.]
MAKISALPIVNDLAEDVQFPVVQSRITKRLSMLMLSTAIAASLPNYYKGDKGDPSGPLGFESVTADTISSDDAANIADKLGALRAGAPFRSIVPDPGQGSASLEFFFESVLGQQRDGMLLHMAADGEGSGAYPIHILYSAGKDVTTGGAFGAAANGKGRSFAGVFNKYEDGPGGGASGNRVGSGDGFGLLGNFASSGTGAAIRAIKQNVTGVAGGPSGIGPALVVDNISEEGAGIVSTTAANTRSAVSNTFERQNVTAGIVTRVQILKGGERTGMLSGLDVIVAPGTPLTGAAPMTGAAITLTANVRGSVEATGLTIVNNAGGGSSGYGTVIGCFGDNDLNTGLFAQAAGGRYNRAARFDGDIATSGNIVPTADAERSLGGPGARFSTVYAASGTINTSDARAKMWRGRMSEAHLRAARRISAQMGLYQWLDQIKAKGEDAARVHFGAKAQDIIEIFYDEGLETRPAPGEHPSFRHAFLCYDHWDDGFEDVMVPGRVKKLVTVPVDTGVREYGTKNPANDEEDAIGVPVFEFREIELEVDGLVKDGERLARLAGNRYGLRIGQLALFLAAANAERLSRLEKALEAA